jgi:hypothetical protein
MACGNLRIPALIEVDYSLKTPINAESVSAPASKATGNSAARMLEITIEGKVTPPARQTDKERYRLLQNHGEHYEKK